MKRFVLYTRHGIEQAPLQTYLSLVFAPTKSNLRMKFSHRICKWIPKLPNVQDEWGALQQALEGHEDSVNGVAFSRDGKLLASASNDSTIKL